MFYNGLDNRLGPTPVEKKLINQDAYFYLKKDEYSDNLVVQAKLSTMFYCNQKGALGEQILGCWEYAKIMYNYDNSNSVQDYLYWLAVQPPIEVNWENVSDVLEAYYK